MTAHTFLAPTTTKAQPATSDSPLEREGFAPMMGANKSHSWGPWSDRKHRCGRTRRLGNPEIALAMEMQCEGLRIKWIARGLGVSYHHLEKELSRARQYGMVPERQGARTY